MYNTNTNIFQPRILHKPELNETLPKTNFKKIARRSSQSNTYFSCQLLELLSVYYLLQLNGTGRGCRGCPPATIPKSPTEGRVFWVKKMPLR